MSETVAESPLDRLIDQPISSGKHDLLRYGELAVTIAKTILDQPNNSALTVGIDGAWGSGKSSILRLLLYELDNTKCNESFVGIGLVVVPFSPWLISNRTALISELFEQLDKAIDTASQRTKLYFSLGTRNDLYKWFRLRRHSITKNIRSARKTMSRFAGLATLASTAMSAVDPTLNAAVVAETSGKMARAIKPGERSLEQLKAQLVQCLKEIAKADNSFRILVIVDDLDRLEPQDALEVLRLVKAVTDFPAVTYVLAYDRHALAKSIAKSGAIDDGNAYLEKIFQLSFKVPPLEPFRLRTWLRDEVERLFPKQLSDSAPHAHAVLDVWAGRLLRTPRDVKRLLFAVRTVWCRLDGKGDLLDLIWLQLIKEKASTPVADLYGWVARYLQSLDALAIGGSVSGTIGEQNELVEILKALGWREYNDDEGMDSIDFHFLDRLLAGITQDHLGTTSMGSERWTHRFEREELDQNREKRRLSSPWHWRLYFALDHPSHAVTDDEWTTLKEAAGVSQEKLSRCLEELLRLGSADGRDVGDQVINRVIFDARSSSIENPIYWLRAVMANACAFSDLSRREREIGFDKEFDSQVKVMVKEIIRGLDHSERCETIRSFFCQSEDLGVSAAVLREQFAASKEESNFDHDTVFLTNEELETAVACQIRQFELLDQESFRNISSPYDVLYAWKEVTGSSKGAEIFLNKACESDEGLLDIIVELKFVTNSEQNNVPHVPESFLKNFMDVHAVKSRLNSMANSESEHSGRARELLNVWWSGN